MASSEVTDEIAEHLSCPVCFEVPDTEVYQCLDGHVLCKKCYFQLTECPQCRIPLDLTRPIRNRHFEGLLESITVKCKNTFCKTKLPKSAIGNHEENCCYNKKFGDFVKLCKLMGHSTCDFEVNNGNTEEAVQHFISAHYCVQSKQEIFQMELKDHQVNRVSKEIHFWTPIISNLEDKQCYILTMALMDSDEYRVGWLSFFLPYNKNPNRNQSSLKTSFTVRYNKDPEEPFVWTTTLVPVQLSKANSYLPLNVPCLFPLSWLLSQSSVLIDCEIMPKDCFHNGRNADGRELIVCTKYSSRAYLKHGRGLRFFKITQS